MLFNNISAIDLNGLHSCYTIHKSKAVLRRKLALSVALQLCYMTSSSFGHIDIFSCYAVTTSVLESPWCEERTACFACSKFV